MTNFFTLLLVFFFCLPGHACEISSDALLDYETQVLDAAKQAGSVTKSHEFMAQAEQPLICLFDIYLKSGEMFKAIAGQFVSAFLGVPPPKEIPHSYQLAVSMIKAEVGKSSSVFRDKIFSRIAEAHWSIYIPLCQPEMTYVCRGFLFDNDHILKQPELVGAVAVSNILQATPLLPAKDQKELLDQLWKLSPKVPKDHPILKKAVEEALERLMVNPIPLGLIG